MSFTMTFISVSDSGLRYLSQVIEQFSTTEKFALLFKENIKIHTYFVGENRDHSEKFDNMRSSVLLSDIILIDLMGTHGAVVNHIESIVKDYNKDLVLLGKGSEYLVSRARLGKFNLTGMRKMMNKKKASSRMPDMEKMLDRMEKIGSMFPIGPLKDMRNSVVLSKFWRFAGPDNIKNMILMLAKDYGKLSFLPNPGTLIDYSKFVLFDPISLTGFNNLDEFKTGYEWNSEFKTIGLLFYSFNYPNYSFAVLGQIIKHLKQKYNVVPIGISAGTDKFKKIENLINNGLKLDILWNFLPFRFGAGPMGGDAEAGLNIFRKFNVPVLHPFFMGKRKIEEWQELVGSLNPMELIIHIMLPELDGTLDAIPIAGLQDNPTEQVDDLKELKLIPGRFDKIFYRSAKYINLRNKPNKDKRVAFIIYNYPPGEGNVGSASFLDTFKSIENILGYMKKQGYNCSDISCLDLEEFFMNKGVCNSGKWFSTDEIKQRYLSKDYVLGDKLHQTIVNNISQQWGNPPGHIMAKDDRLLISGFIDKNIFIGLQPSRGVHEDPSKQYHDKDLSPHHQYLGFYKWLENKFNADVIVHVGTHGTLEFLPGKESALSDNCYPDYLMGDMPHLYLYYSGNPSEATIAKRRIYGCLISYSGPFFKRSGSYGDYVELEDMINEYEEAKALSPQKQDPLIQNIIKKTKEMKLIVSGDFDVDNISKELIRLKTSLMPVGLHQIGKSFTRQEQVCFLNSILCWDRGHVRSIQDIICDEYDRLDDTIVSNSLLKADHINEMLDHLIEDYFLNNKDYYKKICKKLSAKGLKEISAAMDYGTKCLKKIEKTDEVKGIIRGLNGEYIETRLGGDLIRDPEIFPTGYNIHQFDPRLVPSETAMARGAEIANSTIEYYYKNHNKYPESVTVVLWGLETSRTRGETIGQIMTYLGVGLKQTNDSMVKKFQVIPLEELSRPRIDCVVTICGFFRDMFPNILVFLDEIFEAVSMLDEPLEQNFVKKHSLEIYNDLIGQKDEKLALELSFARIFGPPEGQYGTGITTMIESGNWIKETDIADAYLSSQKHIYTRNHRGVANEDVFRSNLKKVDLVSQVRSSVDYSFSDLDHYYEYFGGLSKSVESVKGKKPEMLVSDSSTNVIYTDQVKKAVEIGVRTRLLNPEYIKQMLKHNVHGAQQINKRVENLIGLVATTGSVDTWIFDAVKKTYFDDQDIFDKLKENNKFATTDMIKRLIEAYQRGYWDAQDSDMQELQEKYLELEGDIEDLITYE